MSKRIDNDTEKKNTIAAAATIENTPEEEFDPDEFDPEDLDLDESDLNALLSDEFTEEDIEEILDEKEKEADEYAARVQELASKFHELEHVVKLDAADIMEEHFQTGIGIVYDGMEGDLYRVVATVPYEENADHDLYWDAVRLLPCFENHFYLRFEMLPPISEFYCGSASGRMMTEKEFYEYDQPMKDARLLAKLYKLEAIGGVKVHFLSDRKNRFNLYFGVSFKSDPNSCDKITLLNRLMGREFDLEDADKTWGVYPQKMYLSDFCRRAERLRNVDPDLSEDDEEENTSDGEKKRPEVDNEIFMFTRGSEEEKDGKDISASGGILADYAGSSPERKIRKLIRNWLAHTNFESFCRNIEARVKGQEDLRIFLANVYNYMTCVAGGRPHNNHMLLTAPSGCGKTETYRAIREYFARKIPELVIYQLDMTSITEEGFKGKDTNDMLTPLFKHPEHNGVGIAFLDEFDKKLIPSYTSNGSNVNKAIQSQILTAIEGRIVTNGKDEIDTCNTLFIGMGAFDECRAKKSEVIAHVGFGQTSEGGKDHYTRIERQDMIDLGASYELIGRFSTVISYHRLGDEVVDNIINMMAAKIGAGYGCSLEITPDMRRLLHENSNTKFGCRMMESLIRDAALIGYLEILNSDRSLDEAVIRVEGEKQATVTYRGTDKKPSRES